MKHFNYRLIQTVLSAFSGKRLEKIQNSLEMLDKSLTNGAWLPGTNKARANAGFYQGIARTRFHRPYGSDLTRAQDAALDNANDVDFSLQFGMPFRGKDVELGIKTLRQGKQSNGKPIILKLTDAQIIAWLELCLEKKAAVDFLDEARPKPVVTKIGLSPKVTKTLQEMNLNIDVSSIVPAELVRIEVPTVDKKGKKVTEIVYVVKWSKGVKHRQSRFSTSGGCEACGKSIPSGRFVPVEAFDQKKSQLISLWLGCDCAQNIFGIKDIGVKKQK